MAREPILFSLYRIMRRVVTLLNQVAATLDDNAGLQAQMDGAVKAAKRGQDDNLLLKQASPAQADLNFLIFFLDSYSNRQRDSTVWSDCHH